MAATVFVFTGRAYYAHPGLDWQMTIVQEDYVTTRPFKGTWKQAQAWMCKHGYRKLWGTPAQDGRDGTQVWGLVDVFGDTRTRYEGQRDVKARYEQAKKSQAWVHEHDAMSAALSGLDTMRQYAQAGA